jgi:hypothetical protein
LSRRSSGGFEASIISIYLSDRCGRAFERSPNPRVPLFTSASHTGSPLGHLPVSAIAIEVITSQTQLNHLAFLNSDFSIHHPPSPLGEWLKATKLAALARVQRLNTGTLDNQLSNRQHQNLDTPEVKHLKSR